MDFLCASPPLIKTIKIDNIKKNLITQLPSDISNNNFISENYKKENNNNLSKHQIHIIDNIININYKFNKSKHNFAVINRSKNLINNINNNSVKDTNDIQTARSKNIIYRSNHDLNYKNSNNNDIKTKNNLEKNLLTLITNNNTNNSILNKNVPCANQMRNNNINDNTKNKQNIGLLKSNNNENKFSKEKEMKAYDNTLRIKMVLYIVIIKRKKQTFLI